MKKRYFANWTLAEEWAKEYNGAMFDDAGTPGVYYFEDKTPLTIEEAWASLG